MNFNPMTRWLAVSILVLTLLTLFPISAALADSGSGLEFTGVIQSLPGSGLIGDWQVSGKTIHVTNLTYIEQHYGPAVIGATVEVKGTPQSDGSINALKIEVKAAGSNLSKVKFTGVVVSLPASGLIGDWQVTGQVTGTQSLTVTVHVSSATKIEQEYGKAEVGARVKIEGVKQNDNSINALEIEVLESKSKTGNKIELYGKIESLPSSGLIGDWKVNGTTIHVTKTTKIDQEHGKPVVGAFVKVEGISQADGSVNAQEIEVRSNNTGPAPNTKYIKFYGVIQALPASGLVGDWTINGMTVHVTATTKIEREGGAPVVGGRAEVKGILQTDGSVNALKIETKQSSSSASSFFGKAAATAR